MNWLLLGFLIALCLVLMVLERRGLRTTLALHFKGDVKRETRWLAQYGQGACTVAVAMVIFQLDPNRRMDVLGLGIASGVTSGAATLLKRLVSRVRPGRENAGRFLGPTWTHANYKESFPSSHSASAVALSVILAQLYPQGTITFWLLALGCAGLRYVLDAHWPSDVVGGIALGYFVATEAILIFHLH